MYHCSHLRAADQYQVSCSFMRKTAEEGPQTFSVSIPEESSVYFSPDI